MISSNVGRRAKFFFMFGAAGRSAPMMGINRSSFSRRTILFLFVLLVTPMASRSATLDDSARELARKVAAGLPPVQGVSVEMRNVSSATPGEFAGVEQSLRNELDNLKVQVVTTGAAPVRVRITLSENIKGLLLSAEIIHADTSQVILMEVPRTSEFRIASYLMPIVLQSKIIWEGPEQILDAMIAPGAGGQARLVLLLPDGLEIQDTPGSTTATVQIPSAGNATRDPRGKLEVNGNVASAMLASRICTVNMDTLALLECHAAAGPDESLTEAPPHELLSPERGTEMLMPQNGCEGALATGSGDYTQPDWVQAFSLKPPGLAISNKLDFPGPVLALRGGSGLSRAIVRNLKTGNYEAYNLSCGK